MGLTFTKWLDDWYKSLTGPSTILILGLDNAGKTMVLYCMKLKTSIQHTIPTVGFNIEEINYENLTIKAWDLGGQSSLRSMWKHYYEGSDAIIFVVDSNDKDRLQEASDELYELLDNQYLKDKPFLIFANKQDLPCAVDINEFKKKMRLENMEMARKIRIVGCSAINNEKIDLGLKWLRSALI
tara:strand:+ start:131 stop:679 length:549 start_codon:yes stop_codon:yes gene_type:complete